MRLTLFLSIILFALAVPIFCQNGRGLTRVYGKVSVDKPGSISERIPYVRIRVTAPNGYEQQQLSGEDGSFEFSLPSGMYSISADCTRQNACEPFTVQALQVPKLTWKSFDIRMKILRREPVSVPPLGGTYVAKLRPFTGKLPDVARAVLGGTVYDPQGAVIPGMTITLTAKGKKIETWSNSDGYYEVSVPVGDYEIVISGDRKGFVPVKLKQFIIAPLNNGKMSLDVAVRASGTFSSNWVGPKH